MIFFFGLGLLISALIVVFFYAYCIERRYRESFRYNPKADYNYAFPEDSSFQVMLEKDGFLWPSPKTDTDTAFLKVSVHSNWTSIFFPPYMEIHSHGIVVKQYFEKTSSGIRYVNLSPLLAKVPTLVPGEKLVIKGHHLSWASGVTDLYLFQNLELKRARVLVLAPHPDDAEIAAFGLYNDQDASIITITAGERGKSKYKRFFKTPQKHALFQGKIRTWDSLVIPFWGNISPKKCLNLGYFDGTLKTMACNPDQKIHSESIGTSDLNTFRQYNISDLLPRDTPAEPTWNNLVTDLERLLTKINPSIIVTPNPLTDGSPDHQFTTLALLEALQRISSIQGSLYLYTVHSAYTTRWPFGTEESTVSLPPFFSKLSFFEKIYALHLSSDVYNRKFFALDDLHVAIPMRKFLRMDELFFVTPVKEASALREMFLGNFALKDQVP